MRALIVHNLSFTFCASALWALLPVIARDQLALGAAGFGILSASFGIGAVVGALLLPRGLQRTSLQTMVTSGFLLWIVGALLVASAGRHGGGNRRRRRHRRGLDRRPLQSVGRDPDCGAGLGARARGVDESHRRAGEHGAGQRAVGLARVIAGHAHRARRRRPPRCCCCSPSTAASGGMGDEADVTPGVQLPDLAIAVEPQPDDGPC